MLLGAGKVAEKPPDFVTLAGSATDGHELPVVRGVHFVDPLVLDLGRDEPLRDVLERQERRRLQGDGVLACRQRNTRATLSGGVDELGELDVCREIGPDDAVLGDLGLDLDGRESFRPGVNGMRSWDKLASLVKSAKKSFVSSSGAGPG